jgi:hypothetical protein
MLRPPASSSSRFTREFPPWVPGTQGLVAECPGESTLAKPGISLRTLGASVLEERAPAERAPAERAPAEPPDGIVGGRRLRGQDWSNAWRR